MIGTLSIAGKLFGLLQQDTGELMIDLIGPMRVFRGDDLALVLTVTDDEDERVDLTDATITLQVRSAPGAAGDPVITKTIGSGITLRTQTDPDPDVDVPTIGQADIAISSSDTTQPAGLYWLDVVVVLESLRQHVIAPVEFTIAATVTP